MEQEEFKSIIDAKDRQIQEYRELIKTFKDYDKRRKKHYKKVLKENERLSTLVAELRQVLQKYQNGKVIETLQNQLSDCLVEKKKLELIIAHNEYIAESGDGCLEQYEQESNILLLRRQIKEQKKELKKIEHAYEDVLNRHIKLKHRGVNSDETEN